MARYSINVDVDGGNADADWRLVLSLLEQVRGVLPEGVTLADPPLSSSRDRAALTPRQVVAIARQRAWRELG